MSKKHWVFTKPVRLALVKINGLHYVEETNFGFVEKEKDVIAHIQINNIKELKNLRMQIRKGKYAEFFNAPITDQLWAILAQRTGFMRLVDKEEGEDELQA